MPFGFKKSKESREPAEDRRMPKSRYYRMDSPPPGSFPVVAADIASYVSPVKENNDTSLTQSETSFVEGLGKEEVYFRSTHTSNIPRKSTTASTATIPVSNLADDNRNASDAMLDTIALTCGNGIQQPTTAVDLDFAMDNYIDSDSTSQHQDDVTWTPHESIDSASEGLISFVSNMTLGSPAGALTSSAIGLSLLTSNPFTSTGVPQTQSTTASNLVQRSIERHVHVSLDHCRASMSGMAATSAPVDVDDMSFVQITSRGLDEAALQYISDGEPKKAIELYQNLLHNQRRQRRSNHSNAWYKPSLEGNEIAEESEIAATKSRLASLSLFTNNSRDAWTYSVSALQTFKKAGVFPIHLTLSTIELGLVYFQQGKLTRALRAWREALQLACSSLGYDHLITAILLNNLGCLHAVNNNIPASIRALEESLDLHRTLLRASSECCSSVEMPLFQMATTMCNLAVISDGEKSFEASVSFLEEAIAIQESLTSGAASSKHHWDAEEFREGSIRRRDAENGVGARDVHGTTDGNASTHSLSTFNSITRPTIALFGDTDGIPRRREATKHLSPQRFREDEDDYIYDCILMGSLVKPATARQRIHATMKNSLERVAKMSQPDLVSGDDEASITSATQIPRKKHSIPVDLDGEAVIDAELLIEEISMQALDHLSRNEFKDALDLFESALRSHTDKYGEVHHLVGTALHNCGIVHMLAENYGEAKLCFQGALEVRTAALGDSHPDVAASLFKIGMIEMAQGQLALSLRTFMDIVTNLQRNMTTYGFAPEAIMLNNMGVVLMELGRSTDAFDSFHKAYEIQKSLMKEGSRATERALANTLCNLGFLYSKQGDYSEALNAFRESHAILVEHYSMDHSSIVIVEENIAHVRAYGAVDERQQKPSRLQSSSFISNCAKRANDSGYMQSKLSACFQLQE